MAKPNKRDQQRAQAKAAMPDVQRLVKKYGRTAVANCLNKIHARDREMKKLTALKKQVDQMERGLRA
jgi:hypothetical protein